MKLTKERSRLDIRKHSFSQRIINCRPVLSMQRPSMASRMRMIEKTWTSEADELAGPSSYKYK